MSNEKKRWGIVGGGMLGMALAHRLAQAGQDVTLYEASDHLGGLTSAWRIGDAIWDKYYHVILMSDMHTREVLKELDIDKEIDWVETKTGFYTDRKLYSMSNSIEFLKFPPLSLIDKFRLGATIFYASKVKNWRRLEGMLVGDWLKKLSGKNTFNKIWLPLLRAKLGENYQQTNAAFIWATIQRMYAARKTGLKKEMFGYVRGGYARILDVFAEKLVEEGVKVETNHIASRVAEREGGGMTIDFNNGKTEVFDEVIMTIPSHVAAKITDGLKQEETEKLKGIQYLGVVCASLLLKKPISHYYVTNVTDATPFTGVIEMTAMVNKEFFGGHSLVYLPKYLKASHPFYSKSEEEIKQEFWGTLLDMYPHLKEDDLVEFKVAKAPNVFALTTLDYSQTLPPISLSIPGLHVLNSPHISNGTLNVNETLMLVEKQLPGIISKANTRKSLEKEYE